MAKVSYTKLGLNRDLLNSYIVVEHNEQSIEVRQYLPVNEKLELISNVINKSADQNNFANPVKLEVFAMLEMLYAYTNINFTEKQKEDEIKLYDYFISSGLWDNIKEAIPESEFCSIMSGIFRCAEAVYTYRNSLMGMLESIGQDYSALDLDATEIQNKLKDPENMTFLKDVLTKLG